ncbi:hypothetical protein D3C87_1200350 [compost metagenome]
MIVDQMAFFPPGHELKLQIPEVLKKVVIKRCIQNVDDFLDVVRDSRGVPLTPYQREFYKCQSQELTSA